MKSGNIGIILVGLLAIGCEKEIAFRQGFEPQIVVNALLNPDSLLTVDLWWSRDINDNQPFRRVENASVRIFENERPILEAVSGDSPVEFDYAPLEGVRYSINVSVDGRTDITAATVVPFRPSAECVFEEKVDIPGSGGWGNDPRGYNHYVIRNLDREENTYAVYLDVLSYYDPKYEMGYDAGTSQHDIYTGNIYADTFNRSVFPEDAAYKGSPYEYYLFVRIPDETLTEANPIRFSVFNGGRMPALNSDGMPSDRNVAITDDVTLTAAGYDYDRYFKAVFLYGYNTIDVNPFIFEIYPIPSNITNGLGIFAGYSQRTFRFDFNEPIL